MNTTKTKTTKAHKSPARPGSPSAEWSWRHPAKPFILTSEGLCKFIEDHTRTPQATIKFLRRLGCSWDKDGNVSVQPL